MTAVHAGPAPVTDKQALDVALGDIALRVVEFQENKLAHETIWWTLYGAVKAMQQAVDPLDEEPRAYERAKEETHRLVAAAYKRYVSAEQVPA